MPGRGDVPSVEAVINEPGRTLRAENLTRVYGSGAGEVRAVDGVDLDFDPGSLTAVMGPSGSGKSTLMHLLAGLDHPDAGRVTLGGVDLGALEDDELTLLRRTRMGFVFQSFNLFAELTVAENIDLPFTISRDVTRPDPAWRDRLVDELGLGAFLGRRPTEVSGGQQQRAAIARALVHKPAVVFADEPTGNLDAATSRDVLGLLASLAPAQGSTVIMVTHDPVAASHADRVVVVGDGRIVLDLPATPAADLGRIALAELTA